MLLKSSTIVPWVFWNRYCSKTLTEISKYSFSVHLENVIKSFSSFQASIGLFFFTFIPFVEIPCILMNLKHFDTKEDTVQIKWDQKRRISFLFYTWKGNYFHRKLDHFDLLKEGHIKVEWNTAWRLSATKKANNLVETHWTIFLLQTKCFT